MFHASVDASDRMETRNDIPIVIFPVTGSDPAAANAPPGEHIKRDTKGYVLILTSDNSEVVRCGVCIELVALVQV